MIDADEDAFWDREQIRWTFQLPNTNGLKSASPILIECLLSIAEELEAWEYFTGYST